MTKFNGLISKIGLLFLSAMLIMGCDEEEVTINIPIPTAVAPAPPDRSANSVKSLYSNAYTNGPVDTWSSPRASSTTEVSFIQVAGDDVIQYRNLNFARVEFSSTPINAMDMDTLHMDIWTPDPISVGSVFKVLLIDFGANGVFNGGDDSSHEITISNSSLSSGNWISLDIPLSSFTGLSSRANLAQMVLSGTLANLYIDNVYFYGESEVPPPPPPAGAPTVAAPTPTDPAEEVLSIFSDSYEDVANTNFNPNWGQSGFGTAGQIAITGNNTLSYPNFNYQGIDIAGEGNSVNVSTYQSLHLDYYSTNATALNVFLISSGGVETPVALTVPTSGWSSIDIPLSSFAPVNLAEVIQFKFDGGDGSTTIYLDNVYFHTLGGGGGGNNCPTPPAGEFIVDGDFEADAGCWELFANQTGTSTTIVTNESNGGGTNSARIKTARASNPAIKQTRFGVGVIQPNTTYVVKFDIRSDAGDPLVASAVLNAFAFSESAEGSDGGAVQHTLVGGDPNVPSTWTTRTYTFTTAANVAGGVSLLIELVTGDVEGASGTIFIDNVSFRAQ